MYDRVLIPTDGSPGADSGIELGLGLADAFEADVHALYVVDARPYAGAGLDDDALAEHAAPAARQATAGVVERAAAYGLDVTEAVVTGIPHVAIRDYVERHDVDCAVMATHGRTGVEAAALGSTTERVLQTADVPVLTVRLEPGPTEAATAGAVRFDDVLVPTDGSDAAARAVEHAVGFAERFGGTVHALYVVDTAIFDYEDAPRSLLGTLREGGRRALAEVESLAAEAGVATTTDLVEGRPYREILDYADGVGADLVVLGRRGRTGLPEVLLGSTTARVVRRAEMPVSSVT